MASGWARWSWRVRGPACSGTVNLCRPRRWSRLPSSFYSFDASRPVSFGFIGLVDDRMGESAHNGMQGALPPEAVKCHLTWLQALVKGPTTKFGIGIIVRELLALEHAGSATGS